MENSKNLQRLKKRLEGDVGRAIADYNMIEHGDTLLVCISGGKDSYAMLSLLMAMQQRAPSGGSVQRPSGNVQRPSGNVQRPSGGRR